MDLDDGKDKKMGQVAEIAWNLLNRLPTSNTIM